jgi:MoaA/NifB/PqqE/SkfB family radical SAM enzyme
VRMQTAGLYSKKELIKQCVINGARDINVSIDSLNEKLSDYINGLDGSWANALKTISFISQTFPHKDSICALGCVLSRYNIDEIEAVLDFATRIGWWLSLVPVHITNINNPMNFRGYDDYFSLNITDSTKIKELIDRLKKKKRKGYKLFDSDDYLDSIYSFITSGKPSWRKNNICDTPNLYFAILPDGSFAPCCDYRLDEKIYLYDKKFPEIYRSKVFKKKVKGIANKCPGCNFGSFPEMTLSVRSFSTIKERILLQMKAQNDTIKPFTDNELYSIINEIKTKYNVYDKNKQFTFRDKKFIPSILKKQ